jgi:hypothetical protein
MKKIAILLLLAVTPGLWAQEEITRVFQLKYVSPGRLAEMLGPFGTIHVSTVEPLKTITVRANPTMLAEFEKLVQRFDVPPPPVPNIDVTIYLMSALRQPAASTVPAELEGVVKQLKSTFSYKGFQLIDTQVIRVRAGQGGEASGVVEGQSVDGNKAINQVKFRSASVSTDAKGHAIRIDGLKVGLKIPVVSAGAGGGQKQYQYLDTGINTDVDIREGQKVVVGKANMDGSDRASIVVLTAKVVE